MDFDRAARRQDLDRSAVEVWEIHKMGRAAVDSNELFFFDNWRVPASDLVGTENEGFKLIMHGMNAEQILIGAEALGLGLACIIQDLLKNIDVEVMA
ncbi:hypothetical protein BDW59DRAFT_157627 [Aspergillus cavernicola]|uniref:Uncharacterized protein n=1 Tax=Aspergillus cavernicola TaxID=176166 RepID=A0ABR4IXX8_9EURO